MIPVVAFPPPSLDPVPRPHRRRRPSTGPISILCAVLAASAFLAGGAAAGVIHVPGDFPTIGGALASATSGDTVLVACGVYGEHDLVMPNGVCLRSESGDPGCATIDAGRMGRVFYFDGSPGATRVEGFTLTGGEADQGGAAYLISAWPTISRCRFTGNHATDGGSAIAGDGAEPVLVDCEFVNNARTIDGGAIHLEHSFPTLIRCLIAGNSALFWGGGIFCQAAGPTITNCTIVDNWAGDAGGGIWCVSRSHPVLEATIVALNRHGSGIYAVEDPIDPSVVTLSCCDAYGNGGGNYGGSVEDPTGTNGNISEDPLFCGGSTGDYRLQPGSPCLPENNSCGILIGALGGCGTADAAGAARGAAQLRWRLANPLRPGALIEFDLAAGGSAGGDVSLSVLDPAGRIVRTLIARAPLGAGGGSARWDGRDDEGRPAAPGIYFLRLQAPGAAEIRKIVLME